jgi:predicted transcriptional regulator of viral defense system
VKRDFFHAKEYVESLASGGRYHFTSAQAQAARGASADAIKLALSRLKKQGRIASPARGFYVIVPPEYRSLGCLPADQFIPALMEHLKLPYYAGLLSAAQYYGAAHQRPQQFQVFVEKNRRPIKCGAVRTVFIARKDLKSVPTRSFNTPRGTIAASTPEGTAVDLAGYPEHAGGLEQSATVLSELSEHIDPELLAKAAASAPVPWAQRLGYLLELGEGAKVSGPLKDYVGKHARDYTPLAPSGPKDGKRAPEWKLIVNEEVEPEF